MNGKDLDTNWSQVQTDLGRQQTKQTFDTIIKPTRLIAVRDDLFVIHTETEMVREWLEGRFKDPVARAISSVFELDPSAIRLEFVVNGNGYHAPLVEGVEGIGVDAFDWTTLPTELLEFNPYNVGGYFAVSNYIQRFWGAYLGAAAMQLLDYVRSFYYEPAFIYDKKAKKNILNPNWQPWTPGRDFHLAEMVRAINGTDKQVRGCWRTCALYNAEVSAGNIRDCCFCHLRGGAGELAVGKPAEGHPDGKPICHFWRAGLLDLFKVEEIAHIEMQGDPDKPATVMFRLSIYQPLPPLTPWQMGRLPETVQTAHLTWLSTHKINVPAWKKLAVDRLMPYKKRWSEMQIT